MDTSGYYPQLSTDDPLFEVADYTQLMKTRLDSIRHAEFTANITTGAGALWDPGVFTASSPVYNNTFVVPDATGKLKILESGIYAVSIVIMSATNPGAAYGLVKNGASNVTYAATTNSNGQVWEIAMNMPNLYLWPAGDPILWFRMQTANAVNTSTRVRVTKLQGV